MENETLKINDQFTLALVLEQASYGAINIKTILNLCPFLQDDVLLLRDFTPATVNPMTYAYEQTGYTYLMFRNATSKKAFMDLYDELQARHDWDAAHDLLPMYRGNYVNGCIVPHFKDSDGPVVTLSRMEDFRQQWEWILQNCQNKVQWSNLFWVFYNDVDASLFKLKFPK